jgi:integrase/recombinase XerD
MKINRHGKAKVLTQAEIQLLFSYGLTSNRDRALFSVCLFSACRINEACTLKTVDVYDSTASVRPQLILRKENTKGKLATRSIPIIADLRSILTRYYPEAGQVYVFPGRFDGTHINPDSAARILRKACRAVGIQGVSTHSFRRTALTSMSDAGYPLRVIQKISGHRDLSQLQEYLEVRDEQVLGAVSSLSMLSPLSDEVGKYWLDDFNLGANHEEEKQPKRSPGSKNQH